MDIKQQRCGHGGCIAWRLSCLGSNGEDWRACWSCGTRQEPIGELYAEPDPFGPAGDSSLRGD
jgi:hypothetical protein